MTVGIYNAAYNSTLFSQNGTFTNPIIFKLPAGPGSTQVQLFLRHAILAGPGAESSSSVSVQGYDIDALDESGWIQIAPDVSGVAGTYGAAGASVNLGDVNGGAVVPFWAKINFPSGQPYGVKQDLELKVSATQTSSTKTVDISQSTSMDAGITYSSGTINSTSNGYWYSVWFDTGGSQLSSINLTKTGFASTQLRSSPNADGSSPSAWYDDPLSAGTTARYIQIRIYFQSGYIPGLARTRYTGGTSFNIFRDYIASGSIPNGGVDGDNQSVKWVGYFYAPTTGSYYFHTTSDDGVYCYLDTAYLYNNLSTPGGAVQGSATVSISAGYHYIEYGWQNGTGGYYITATVAPPSQAERAVALSDFFTASPSTVTALNFVYTGAKTLYFDINAYDGPDTPQYVAPAEGYLDTSFRPDLTVIVHNCDHVEFQMDQVKTFNSANLQDWQTVAINDANTVGNDPVNLPASGLWYWRARGVLGGVVGGWTDYHLINIAAIPTEAVALYQYAQVVLDYIDPITGNRAFYEYAQAVLDTLDYMTFGRAVYEYANVANGVGNIVYPIQDNTVSRLGALLTDPLQFPM